MTREDFKKISEVRMKGAQVLIEGGDWFWASYTMAMALECALKGMVCKTLTLDRYPEDRRKSAKIVNFFWTHEFEQLLILAGLSLDFSPAGTPEAFQNWSDFTKEFPGDWVTLRYDYERQSQFIQEKANSLKNSLIEPNYGILTIIQKKW